MKLTVSMTEADVEFIDQYAADHGVDSRSAVVQRALRILRSSTLGDDYAAAWDEWVAGDGELWDGSAADGIVR